MKVLVVGNGAREHTLVWKLAQSPKVTEIYAAPGNAGTAQIAANLNIKPADIESLVKAVKEHHIELVVVGPEAPLAEGIVDRFRQIDITIFGPTRDAAQIEVSKAVSKALFKKLQYTLRPEYDFSDPDQAKAYVQKQGAPLVVKADGLAAGKGVIIAETVDQCP